MRRSCLALWACALVPIALLGLVHALGWRADTSILVGIAPPDGFGPGLVRGGSYFVVWMAAVTATPSLAVGGVIELLLAFMAPSPQAAGTRGPG